MKRPPANTPGLRTQDGLGLDAIAVCRYFLGESTWLVSEWDGEDIVFGWAILNGDRRNAELGYTSLAELASVSVPVHVLITDTDVVVRIRVELDESWTPIPLRDAIAALDARTERVG